MVSFHICLDLPSDVFLTAPASVTRFLVSPCYVLFNRLVTLDLIVLTTSGGTAKLLSSSVCNFPLHRRSTQLFLELLCQAFLIYIQSSE